MAFAGTVPSCPSHVLLLSSEQAHSAYLEGEFLRCKLLPAKAGSFQ
jgi:hypothetical protein